jgi:hypothetical protein
MAASFQVFLLGYRRVRNSLGADPKELLKTPLLEEFGEAGGAALYQRGLA